MGGRGESVLSPRPDGGLAIGSEKYDSPDSRVDEGENNRLAGSSQCPAGNGQKGQHTGNDTHCPRQFVLAARILPSRHERRHRPQQTRTEAGDDTDHRIAADRPEQHGQNRTTQAHPVDLGPSRHAVLEGQEKYDPGATDGSQDLAVHGVFGDHASEHNSVHAGPDEPASLGGLGLSFQNGDGVRD